VELFRKSNSKFYWYDFTVRGERYRASTKETNEVRATKIAAKALNKAMEGSDPLDRKAPTLREFSVTFLDWVDAARLEPKSRRYYKNGWRLLEAVKIVKEAPFGGKRETLFVTKRMDQITTEEIEGLKFSGSSSNGNNALKTLRRMFSLAKEKKKITEKPKFKLFKQPGRSLRLNDAAERRLLPVAEQPLKDIIVVMRDTGMRNVREIYCMRIENLDFDSGVIFVPDSKTEEGRRFIAMSNRVKEILLRRCDGRAEGWVFTSVRKGKHIGEAMVNRQWVRAREKAELPEDLVLYCARHDHGSFIMAKTGDLKLVMTALGQSDIKSAMVYQHPQLEVVREAINARSV
jgi:integrase